MTEAVMILADGLEHLAWAVVILAAWLCVLTFHILRTYKRRRK